MESEGFNRKSSTKNRLQYKKAPMRSSQGEGESMGGFRGKPGESRKETPRETG